MSFTPIPTVITGQILTAAHLNLLSDNANFIYGAAYAPNVPMHARAITAANASYDNNGYWIRHRSNTLYYKFASTSTSSVSTIKIYANGTQLGSTISGGGVGLWTGTRDMSSFTDGEWVLIYIETTGSPGTNDTFAIYYLYEQPSAGGSYTSLATLSSGATLTHTHINNIKSNIEYLHDVVNVPNIGCNAIESKHGGDIGAYRGSWVLRHKYNTLSYRFKSDNAGAIDTIKIYGNGTQLGSTINGSNLTEWSGTIDLTSQGWSTGDWVQYYVEAEFDEPRYVFEISWLYEVPPTAPSNTAPIHWAHNEVPTAAGINAFKTTLDNAYTQLGTNQYNFGAAHTVNTYGSETNDPGYIFVHRHQFLHYADDGYIEDIDGIKDPIRLNGGDTATEAKMYDLSNIGWLVPGMRYRVRGVAFAAEDWSE